MEKVFTKKLITGYFNADAGLAIRTLDVCGAQINLFFVECLVDNTFLAQNIISPLSKLTTSPKGKDIVKSLTTCELSQVSKKADIVGDILCGCVLIFVEGDSLCYSTKIAKYATRSIAEPPTDQVTKGPREGFIEDIATNISMLRRRLKTPDLAIKNLVVGRRTKTKIAVMYIDGIAEKPLVQKLLRQLKSIDIDGIIDSYYIESLLEEGKLKFLRRIGNSEKPDVVASRLLEGRVAIVVDGSPIVLTVPYLLIEDLQSPEDYYTIPSRTSFLRAVRLIGLILGFLLPGIYVSLQSYHYRVLPINFLVTLLSNIQGISFPPIIEILFVLFLFDILAEASARMPKLLGMALSIVGALVLGETSVQAGLISPPSIVVVAISSIMLFIVPDQVPQVSLLRILFTIVGGIAGFYGMLMCFVMLTTHLITANGYGAPFLAPYAPIVKTDQQDGVIKKALTSITKRPSSITKVNKTRFIPAPEEQNAENSDNNMFVATKSGSKNAKATKKQAKRGEK
jgi:spore germination protein KA